MPVSQYSITLVSTKSGSRSSPRSWPFQASRPTGESSERVAERLRLLGHQRVERHLVLQEPLERPELALLLLGEARHLRRVAATGTRRSA